MLLEYQYYLSLSPFPFRKPDSAHVRSMATADSQVLIWDGDLGTTINFKQAGSKLQQKQQPR